MVRSPKLVVGTFLGSISAMYIGTHAALFAMRKKDNRMNTIIGACDSGAYFSNGRLRAALQGCVTFAAVMVFLVVAMLAPKEQQMVEETDRVVILEELTIGLKHSVRLFRHPRSRPLHA